MLARQVALDVVLGCLREAVEQAGGDAGAVTEEAAIIGDGGLLDSIGLVSLIVDIEQRLEVDHQVSVTLASERAMSMKSSPFRTAARLAEHAMAAELEAAAA